jgi:hypothetical protein
MHNVEAIRKRHEEHVSLSCPSRGRNAEADLACPFTAKLLVAGEDVLADPSVTDTNFERVRIRGFRAIKVDDEQSPIERGLGAIDVSQHASIR